MTRKSEKFSPYMTYPFWDMRQSYWYGYLDGLKQEERDVLAQYPVKWAYFPPRDAKAAVEFLHEIRVDGERVQPAKIEEHRSRMPTFDDLKARGSVAWSDGPYDAAPSYGFRQIPEWEPMAGVLLHWPIFYPPLWDMYREVISSFDHVTTFLRIPEGYPGAAVLAWLESQGIKMKTVRPIPGPIGDLWGKDSCPLYGLNTYTGEPVAHQFAFSAYGEEYRSIFKANVEVESSFAWVEGFKLHRTEIMIDGGYVQTTDGRGTYILTRRVLWDNVSVPNLHARLESWLGADRLIFIDEQPGDTMGHINHFRFVAPGKVLVGKPDKKGTPLYRYLSKIRDRLAGLGYEVIDLPCPEQYSKTLPAGEIVNPILYANCLMMNDRVLVPIYDQAGIESYNEQSLEAYRKALPDHRIIPLDVSIITNGGGGIYCGSKEIPDIPSMKIE